MLQKNIDKLKRKNRDTFVGFKPSLIDHGKIYNRKQKHKKKWGEE